MSYLSLSGRYLPVDTESSDETSEALGKPVFQLKVPAGWDGLKPNLINRLCEDEDATRPEFHTPTLPVGFENPAFGVGLQDLMCPDQEQALDTFLTLYGMSEIDVEKLTSKRTIPYDQELGRTLRGKETECYYEITFPDDPLIGMVIYVSCGAHFTYDGSVWVHRNRCGVATVMTCGAAKLTSLGDLIEPKPNQVLMAMGDGTPAWRDLERSFEVVDGSAAIEVATDEDNM